MNKVEVILTETNLVPLQGLGVVVIADDITGAAEIAGVCLRYGLKVSFGIDTFPNEIVDVCIVATNSRSESESEAFQIHSKLANAIYSRPSTLVFKKCDSVLRGYVLTELSALMEESQLKNILLQPANPSTGRCIREGIYYVGNEKIENTGFSIDPDFPANDSSVQNLLLQRSKKQEAKASIHTGNIKELHGQGVFVPDCNSIADLQESSKLSSDKTLLCGSAASFEQILLEKGLAKTKISDTENDLILKNFLLIAGTTHPESQRFAEKLKQIGCPVEKFPEQFLQEELNENDFADWLRKLKIKWAEYKMLSIGISDKKVVFPNSVIELKSRLSRVAEYLLQNCDISELLIEGGATTYNILNTLSITSLTPNTELAPGVLRLKVNNTDNLWLSIKPGSYPWPEKII